MSVRLAEFFPLFLGKPFLLEFRILINILVKRDQSACIIEKSHFITVDVIGILIACDQGTCCFCCGLSCQPCFLDSYAPLLRNHLSDLIVVIDFGTGHGNKHSKICNLILGIGCLLFC